MEGSIPMRTAPTKVVASESPWRRALSDFTSSRIAVAGFIILSILIMSALLAPYITPQNPYDLQQLNVLDKDMHPFAHGVDGRTYLLGTDDQGRDIYSGIVFGLRTSLIVGFGSTSVALVIGVFFGLIAAYFGGWLETIIMRVVDLQLSFPSMLIALILLALIGPGLDKVMIAIVAVQWAYYARTVRSAAIVERQKEYIEAAKCLGLSNARVLFSHLLPNSLPPIIVVATITLAQAILLEATLSFLGVGVPVTQPSLGGLIKKGSDVMLSGEYWVSFFPGMVLLVTMVSLNLVGDQLRDALNPRIKK